MSRYDYRDPGTDPAYCNGLGGHPGIERHCTTCGELTWVSRDEEYQVQVFCERCAWQPIEPPVDPAEHAARNIEDGFLSLLDEINRATDSNRVMALRTLARLMWIKATNVCDRAAERVDEDLERRR